MRDFDDRANTKGAVDGKRAGKTDWTRVAALTGEQALQNALTDQDNPPLTDDQLARMRRVPDPHEIRQRLGLTQREFSQQFQIALGTLRDWEQGARRPDSAAKAYLRVIAAAPDAVRQILHVQTEENQPIVPATGMMRQRP
jgi:putative transcriptional regulator